MASQRGRLTIIMAAFLVLAIGLASRALQLQAIEAPAYAASAAARMKYTYDLQPDRGRLTDRNGTVMAQTQPAVLVFVDPRMISRNGADPRPDAGGRAEPGRRVGPVERRESLTADPALTWPSHR